MCNTTISVLHWLNQVYSFIECKMWWIFATAFGKIQETIIQLVVSCFSYWIYLECQDNIHSSKQYFLCKFSHQYKCLLPKAMTLFTLFRINLCGSNVGKCAWSVVFLTATSIIKDFISGSDMWFSQSQNVYSMGGLLQLLLTLILLSCYFCCWSVCCR